MRAMYAVLATLPLLAEAQPLLVEYEGVVEAVDPSPYWNYSVGDTVKGVVRIYPLLAPPDLRPARFAGDYVSGGPTENFVVSDFTSGSRNDDSLFVTVGSFDSKDRYVLSDIGSIESGSPDEFRYFTIAVEGVGLVEDDGIVQSFEAIPKKDGTSIISALMRNFDDLRRTVTFSMSRVSVGMPGSCSK